jgi:hypothetical protein
MAGADPSPSEARRASERLLDRDVLSLLEAIAVGNKVMGVMEEQ